MGTLKPPTKSALVTALPLLTGSGADDGAPILVSASGPAGRIQGEVDAFRGLLGPLCSGTRPPYGSGRCEIGGDSLPDGMTQAGLREVPPTPWQHTVMPGTGLDLGFLDPTDGEVALTRGFGAVFTGEEAAGASLTFLDAAGAPLGIFYAPEGTTPGALSFVGVYFGSSLVSQVRVAGMGGAASLALLIFGMPVPARSSALSGKVSLHLARWGLNGPDDAPRSFPHSQAG